MPRRSRGTPRHSARAGLAAPTGPCYRSGVVRARAPTRAPGKAVRIRRDPVTVIGDETRESHWPRGREGAGSRTIREPGDLPARALFDSVFAGGPGRGFDDSRSRWRAQRQEPLRRRLSPSAGARDLRGDGPGRDGDMAHRIERHRAERPGHWRTLEGPYDLVPRLRDACTAADAVIVDCLTVWVANLLLRGDPDDHILKHADELAALLPPHPAEATLVSNEVGLGVHPATEDGRRFRDLLGFVNQRIAAAADRVVLMVAGVPLSVKDVHA